MEIDDFHVPLGAKGTWKPAIPIQRHMENTDFGDPLVLQIPWGCGDVKSTWKTQILATLSSLQGGHLHPPLRSHYLVVLLLLGGRGPFVRLRAGNVRFLGLWRFCNGI